MDRVKAAIFSSLGDKVISARVLDLFAGTGALGIEALSRGANSALFVESNPIAGHAIERNLATARLQGQIRIQDAFEFLCSASDHFDIIFADPPYERTAAGETYSALLLSNRQLQASLCQGGVFVLEKRPSEDLPDTIPWDLVRAKSYGATQVLFLSPGHKS